VGGDSTFSKGDRVDRFEIRELIAQGGMGAIYRAVDTKLARTVALKVVRTDRLGTTSGEQVRQRFLREALAMSKVDHRNVVRVLDFGFSGDTPYLAMEYLRGQDLGKLLKATTGFLPIAEVVDLMLEVCAAIRACHDADIIHRDLKPSNIFLCDDGTERVVKVLDFGVSKPPIAGDLTREGQIVGTPQYLAPEQIDGKAVPQTDQYAVGVMLYACLTKTLPYQGLASFALLRAIVLGKFTPPVALRSDLPAKLEAIVLRAMRTVPEERFESIHELGRALWEFGSPEARERWRAYYFDERRPPPKASTHAMPLIEALALGIAAEPPAGASVAFASTAVDEQVFAARPAPAPAENSPLAAEAEPSRPAVKRRRVGPFVAGAALAVVAVGWLIARRPAGPPAPGVRRPAPTAAPVRPAPTAPEVLPITSAPPVPAPPAAPAAPRPAAPATVEPAPAPAAPGKTAPAPAAAKTAPAAPAKTARASAAGAASRPSAPTRPAKLHRRNDPRPTSEQTPDGVPIMP
jgi:serine/threonine-protein kinase